MEMVAVTIASRRVFDIEAVIAALIVVLTVATIVIGRRRRRAATLAPPLTPPPPSAGSLADLAPAVSKAPEAPDTTEPPVARALPTGTPAGWLPDPSGAPDTLRYWDGSAWTEHVATRA